MRLYLVLFLAIFLRVADSKAELPEASYYKGTLGKSTIIWMKLYESLDPKNKGVIEGSYYYQKYKMPILLEGKSKDKQTLVLEENGGVGVFNLQSTSKADLSGTWKKFDKKGLEVKLEKTKLNAFLDATALSSQRLETEYKRTCDSDGKTPSVRLIREPDLNGDSIEELSIACEAACGATGNCPYVFYLSHGKNLFSYAGDASGVGRIAQKEKHYGMPDLNVHWKGGCAGMEGTGTILEFDGSEYRDTGKHYKCDCDAAKQKNRSKYCPKDGSF